MTVLLASKEVSR